MRTYSSLILNSCILPEVKDFSKLKTVISWIPEIRVELGYLIPYLRFGRCCGILRISEILLHVKNQRYDLQYWKMWPGRPNLIRVSCICQLHHISLNLARLQYLSIKVYISKPISQKLPARHCRPLGICPFRTWQARQASLEHGIWQW